MRVRGVVSVIANIYYVLSGHITYTSSPDAHNKQSISWAQLLTPFVGEGKEASSSVGVEPGCLARLCPALGACMCACAAKGQLRGELVSKPVISIHPLLPWASHLSPGHEFADSSQSISPHGTWPGPFIQLWLPASPSVSLSASLSHAPPSLLPTRCP